MKKFPPVLWCRKLKLALPLGASVIRLPLAALVLAGTLSLAGQPPPRESEEAKIRDAFVCPMDKDVRSDKPGKCPRCGMRLTADLPEHADYRLTVRATPARFPAGRPVSLGFRVADPTTGRPVRRFEIVHEKLFHLFLISQDLSWFAHEHPEPLADGSFRLDTTFPKPSAYRLLADFYPTGGTPQFLARTLVTAGANAEHVSAMPALAADLAPKRGQNLEVEMVSEPAQPLAGKESLLFFRLKPGDGVEPYLGALGHLLTASDDLIDLIHTHPRYVTDGPQVQFNVLFPREAVYRVWVQFQRKGVVNTVAFTVPVKALR